MNSSTKSIAIIGAGITGLSAAYQLQKTGHRVVLFDKTNRVGGAIQTTKQDGYLAEHGPNSLMLADRRVKDLISELGLDAQLITANSEAAKRFVVHQDKLHALPHSPLRAITTPLISLKGKLRMLIELFLKKAPAEKSESFADCVRRRIGPEMLEKAAGPFVSGIYAGDPEKLSTKHAFPRLWNLEQNYGSFIKGAIQLGKAAKNGTGDPNRLSKRDIVSFQDGMQVLPDALKDALVDTSLVLEADLQHISQHTNGKWKLIWKATNGEGEQDFDHVILTTPAHKVHDLPLDSELLDEVSELKDIYYPPVTSMLLGFRREEVEHPLDGFGMLMAMKQKASILGGLFTSTLFPGRAPEGYVAINVMLGGARFSEMAELSDGEMEKAVLADLEKFVGLKAAPSFSRITRWAKAIPQLNLGYESALAQIESCEQKYKGFHFAGNYRGGISVGDCIISGMKLSEAINT